jgi:hypothetical protein
MVAANKAILIRREISRDCPLIFNESLLEEIDKIPMKMRHAEAKFTLLHLSRQGTY